MTRAGAEVQCGRITDPRGLTMTPRRSTTVVATSTLALLGALAVPPPGYTASSRQQAMDRAWGTTVDLSRPAPYLYDTQVVFDPAANAAAAWVRDDGDRSAVRLASRTAEGAWTTSTKVPGTRGARSVVIAFADVGELVLVWSAGRRVMTSRRSPGQSWEPPDLLHRTPTGSATGTYPSDLRLGVNRRGRAVVAWSTRDDDADAVYALSQVQAVVGTASGSWSSVRTLSGADDGYGPQVTMSRHGRATVAWMDTSRRGQRIVVAMRRVGARWRTRALSRWARGNGGVHLAGQPSGRLAAAWRYSTPTSSGIRVTRWSARTGWDKPRRVGGKSFDPGWIDLGVDGAGTVTVAWSSGRDAVLTAEQPVAGAWSRRLLAPEGSVFHGLTLVVNHAGDALIGWVSVAEGSHPVEAAHRARSSAWGEVTKLSGPDGDAWASFALDRAGDAVAAWSFGPNQPGDAGSWVQVRSFAATAPPA